MLDATPPRLILGLTAPPGAGKTTLAQLLRSHGFDTLRFAGPLKAMLRALYDAQGAPADLARRKVDGDLKELPCEYLAGATPRYAMQTLGTEWGRMQLAGDFWVRAVRNRIRSTRSNVVIDDVRFDNEAAMIRELGGVIVEISRPGFLRNLSDHVAERGLASGADVTILNDAAPERMIDRLAAASSAAEG